RPASACRSLPRTTRAPVARAARTVLLSAHESRAHRGGAGRGLPGPGMYRHPHAAAHLRTDRRSHAPARECAPRARSRLPPRPRALDYAAALAAAAPAGPPVRPTPDDLYIIYTGGTTGAPKGVLWRQEDIFHAAMSGSPPGFEGPTTIEALVAEAEPGVVMRSMPVPPLMHGAAQWVAFGAIHK